MYDIDLFLQVHYFFLENASSDAFTDMPVSDQSYVFCYTLASGEEEQAKLFCLHTVICQYLKVKFISNC